MIKFLRHIAEICFPQGRLFAIVLAGLICLWTAGAMALSPPVGAPIINTATAQCSDANGNPLSAVISNTVSAPLSGAPLLKITAVASPNPVSAGGTQTYTITIENTGNIAASAVTATATLSTNLQFASASNGGVSLPPAVNWTLGDIPSGGSVALTLTATVPTGTASGTALPFSITVLSTNNASDTTSLNTKVGSAPNLIITDSASVASIIPGGFIDYTISYSNIGNIAAANVVIYNDLPSQTALVAGTITGGGSISGRTITWTPGSLNPGASGTVSFKVAVSTLAADGAIIRNISTIICTETAAAVSNELLTTVAVTGIAPPTAAKGFSPKTILVNGASTMTITLANPNSTAVTGAAFTDTYPANLVNTAGASPATTCGGTVTATNGGTSLSLAGGTIPASGSCTVTVNVTSAIAGSYTNSTGAINADGPVTIVSASGTVSVVQLLSIQKTVTTAIARPGNVLAYAITIKNESDVTASNIIIRDTLPIGVTFLSADAGGTATGGTVSWSIAALNPGTTTTVHLNVTIDRTFSAASISNTARVTADGMNELQSTVAKNVTPRTTGAVAFFDASGQPVYGYMDGATIYIQVNDADQNVDPAIAETVTVVLTNTTTSDTETVTLTETSPDTGIFRGSVLSSLSASATNDGTLTVAANSRIQATYMDALDAAPVHNATALIDPQGVVFNSITGNPVSGAVVTLRNWSSMTNSCDLTSRPVLPPGQVNPAAATGTDGKFAFPLVSPGDYCFDVAPPTGYTFPSAVSNTDLPAGFNIGNGSRGDKFNLSVGNPILIRDIPVDPPTGRLIITKTTNKTTAAIGDMVIYTVKLENSGDASVTAITISDVMPHGISYISGSSLTDGVNAADPQSSGGRTFAWPVANLAVKGSITISYRAVVGPDAQAGTGINTIMASGKSVGKTIVSNQASVKIKINEGVFTSKGTIIGRVFIDRDGDGLAKKDTGVPDAVLYLEDGTRVITDKSGKFSISGVVAGTHVLRLDETSLPKGLIPKQLSNRFMKNGTSQFVDMKPSGLFKANFAVDKKYTEPLKPEAAPESKPSAKESIESATSAGKQSGRMSPETPGKTAPLINAPDAPDAEDANTKELPLEEKIKKMTPDLEFLSPVDQTVSGKTSIRVLVKASMDAVLTLTVNGKPVDESHIGKKMTYEKGRVVIYEFLDVRLNTGEENIITAELRDQFNITRGKKQIRVETIGEMAAIVIHTDRNKTEADGQSKIGVIVSLVDSKGHAVPFDNAITVAATAGEILEKDADPANEGHQVMCQNGIAHFTIIAPRETGEAKINVQANNITKSADIYFVPRLRPMFIVGVGEVVLGHGRSSGDISYLKDRSFFGDGTYLDGRGAFFMKGNIYKDVLLTAAYDSNKKRTDELFRESDTRLDLEEKYPIYGDESKTGYEALSRENLYVKLEKDKSYLLYGDYNTDLTETKLSAYTRSFNGLKFEANTEKFKLRSFATHTDQSQFVDILPGNGISGYYYLNHQQIIDGSERVTIETRDRLQPDRVLSRELKSRGSDYEIDYDLGTLLFKTAVPSHDAEGNPLYIAATYESAQDGNKYFIYGGRGAYKIRNWLEAGATGIVEENGISNYHLFGGDIKLNLPGSTILKAEYARTRGLFDISSTLSPEDGEGWSLDLEGRPMKNLSLKGYYRYLSDYFSNQSATDAVRGTSKIGLEAAYEIQPTLVLKAKYLDEKDRINDSSHLLASVGVTKKFTKTTVSAELSHEEAEKLTDTPAQIPYTPGGLLNGVPFLNPYETPERATFLKLALERELLSNLSLSLSHKQDIGGNDYFISQAGMNYKLNNQNRLYVREEYAKYEDGTQNRILLGVESQILKNTTVYDEYRLADGSAGYRNQQVMGLKNKFQIMEGVTANIAGEYLSTLSGQKNKTEPDAYAAAAGLEYLPKDDFKLTGRLEHRNEIDGEKSSYLAEMGAAYKLSPDYSLLLRERYFLEKNAGNDNHTSRFFVGLAYRPLDNDRFNALSKIEYKYNRQYGSQPGDTTNALIFSTEGVFQANRNLQLTGKYAGKLEQDDCFTSYTDLITARLVYDLSDRFDIGAEYRLLTSHLTETRLHGGSVEVGYRMMNQLWLSLGYSFDRFDADLAGDSYEGEGPYLKLRFKFDEKSLQTIRK